MFFGFAIFSLSSKFRTKYCFIKDIIKESTWDIESQKQTLMKQLFEQFSEVFIELNQKSLKFTNENLQDFCKEYLINFSGIEQFIKNY